MNFECPFIMFEKDYKLHFFTFTYSKEKCILDWYLLIPIKSIRLSFIVKCKFCF